MRNYRTIKNYEQFVLYTLLYYQFFKSYNLIKTDTLVLVHIFLE